MSKITIKHARLRDSFFLAGTNFQDKLDVEKNRELSLVYDRDERELLAFYKEEMAIIPREYVAYMHPEKSKKPAVAVNDSISVPKKPIKAQVSTPQDHVFKTP